MKWARSGRPIQIESCAHLHETQKSPAFEQDQVRFLDTFFASLAKETAKEPRAVNMKVSIVDSEPAITAMIDDLEHLPSHPPSLYLDIEGVKLSRHGSISIIQLFVLPKNHVFLVDIFMLKGAAFCTSNRSGTNLRSIFESALVPKVFFDVRNDCDALFSHFQISMAGVHDVQLLEVATSKGSRIRVAGLSNCIENDAQLSSEALAVWKATKQKGLLHFSPEHGGSYEVFNSRPMPQDIIDYCTQDVVYLPVLWRIYTQRISPEWLSKVQDKTCERILASQEPSYEPHGRHKALSPWANTAQSGRGYRSGNTGVKDPERKTTTTGAGVAATESVSKATVTLLNAKPQSQPPVAQEGLRHSARPAALEATKKITKTTTDRAKLDLPIRNKKVQDGKSHDKTALTLHAATVRPKWKCNTCSREMQEAQKEEHLAGKQHIARTKLTTAAQPGKAKQVTLPPTTVTTTIPQTGRSSTKAKSRQTTRRETAEARATTRGGKRQMATAALHSPKQKGLPYPPDHLFIGFQGSGGGYWGGGSSSSFTDIALGYGEDYSVCDKDCGWCGHCMDGIDI